MQHGFFSLKETRRRQQAEAAEKRQKQMEARGVKDPEALKRKQKRQEEMDRQADQAARSGDTALRVGCCRACSLS